MAAPRGAGHRAADGHGAGGDYRQRQRLGRISKRGNKYLPTLLVHCARAGLETLSKREDRLGAWLRRQLENKERSVVIVALAGRQATARQRRASSSAHSD